MDASQVTLTQDIDEARRFFDFVLEDGEGLTLQTFHDRERDRKDVARVMHSGLDANIAELCRLQRDGAGVFWMVNEGDGAGRQEANVTAVRYLFADTDGAPLAPLLTLPPHMVVQSSPGRYHVYWRVVDCSLDRFKPVQRAIAERFGTDKSVSDLPRVMRVPGFLHQKDTPFLVKIRDIGNIPPYTLDDVVTGLGLSEKPIIDKVLPAPVPGTAFDFGKARKAAWDAARRTHEDASCSRHGEVFNLGCHLFRDGLPAEDSVFEYALQEFASHMRPTDASGRAQGMDFSAERKTIRDGYQRAHRDQGEAPDISGILGQGQRAGGPNPMSNVASAPPSPGAAQAQHDRGAGVASSITLTPLTADELRRAQLTPRVILRELLYSDVRTRISGGGTGKTTVALFEAATLALGRELWGRTPDRPCRTVIVTREDGREILAARLREICYAMPLSAGELAQVMENVTILDLSNEPFRLSCVIGDVVYPHAENLDALVAALKPWAPDWVIFDPLVSFGVGEARINDAEQGLIEAFRIIRNRLDCCVEGIHHSGKANAKEKALDQYAGRGGSALSDGCRMVCVMQPLDASEWLHETGSPLGEGESGIVMALPKLSYAKSQLPIFIRRDGYRFSMVTPHRQAPEQKAAAQAEQVLQFIRHEYGQGRRYSKSDLETSNAKLNLSRAEIRAAVTELNVTGRVIYHHINGKAGSHYEPVTVAAAGGDGAENSSLHDDEPSPLDHRRRPIGNEDGGGGAARHSPIVSNHRRDAVATVGDGGDGGAQDILDTPIPKLASSDEIEVEL